MVERLHVSLPVSLDDLRQAFDCLHPACVDSNFGGAYGAVILDGETWRHDADLRKPEAAEAAEAVEALETAWIGRI